MGKTIGSELRAALGCSRSSGMTLIEVLVAILVTCVGVLSVTGLQMLGLQTNRAALLRTEAVQLAHDMMERVRANAGSAAHYDGLGFGDPPPSSPDCGARDCTGRQVADFERAVWKCRLGRFRDGANCARLAGSPGSGFVAGELEAPALPEGDGAIEVADRGGLVRIRVQWRDGGQIRFVAVESRI